MSCELEYEDNSFVIIKYVICAGVSFLDFAVETATVFMKVKNWPIVPMEVETTEENKNACWPATHAAISN